MLGGSDCRKQSVIIKHSRDTNAVVSSSASNKVNTKQQRHLLHRAALQKSFKFMVCILNDIVISQYPSMAMRCKSKSMEGLSVEIKICDKKCQFTNQNFNRFYTSLE
jgi:hypothetical protein